MPKSHYTAEQVAYARTVLNALARNAHLYILVKRVAPSGRSRRVLVLVTDKDNRVRNIAWAMRILGNQPLPNNDAYVNTYRVYGVGMDAAHTVAEDLARMLGRNHDTFTYSYL